MIRATHELHERRKGRNLGLGILLLAFVGIVFGMTIVKIGNGEDVLGTGMVSGEVSQ
ncbi:hypothetical protein [Tropicimonas sediminicola]|uniref:Uncharacterized protein n=1 Tax=Tropicimonas sediminicola TaxID=1031541 RepID=A0A239KIR4_9RHOB|nr:hypothetical protein [Tropicimonas sediminicola]SNT17890.1 hypothetical protein SAMN05421757_107137 [Tropicimonas sediminicola]